MVPWHVVPVQRPMVTCESQIVRKGVMRLMIGRRLGTSALCSLIQIGLAFVPPKILKRIFPPIVTGTVILLIGASLIGDSGFPAWGASPLPLPRACTHTSFSHSWRIRTMLRSTRNWILLPLPNGIIPPRPPLGFSRVHWTRIPLLHHHHRARIRWLTSDEVCVDRDRTHSRMHCCWAAGVH